MRRAILLALTALGLILGLTVLTPSGAGAAPADVHPEWGSTSAKSSKIRQGCRTYTYSYALTPPDGYWSLETFLVGPNGRTYGSGYFVTGDDPLVGDGAWRLCRQSTRGGRYTISAKLSVINGGDYYEGWLPDSSFRLRKPRR